MERSVPCPACNQVFTSEVSGDQLAEYLICAHCSHRFLFDPMDDADVAPPTVGAGLSAPETPPSYTEEPVRDLDPEPEQGGPVMGEPASPDDYLPPEPSMDQMPPQDLPPPPPQWPPATEVGVEPGQEPPEGYDWGSGAGEEPYGGPGDDYVMLFPTTSRPLVAGILLLLAAFIAIGWQVYIQDSFTHTRADEAAAYYNDMLDTDVDGDYLYDAMHKAVIFFTLMAVICMVGAVMALLRSSYNIARIGAVAGLFSMGPFLVSSLISMVGLWLIITSRSEFESEAHETPSFGHYAE